MPHSAAFAHDACRGVVHADWAAALTPILQGLPQRQGFAVVKQSTVRTVLRARRGDLDVHVKLFRSGTLSERARDALRGDRGAREAGNLLAAQALDLPTVEPIAHGTCEDADGGRHCFLVTRTLDGAARFAFALPPDVATRTGRLLRHAHDRGFLPGDLHPGNVVVDGRGAPFLLDLTSVRHGGEPDLRRRAAALAFFCQELDGGPLDPTAAPLLAAYLAAGPALPASFATLLAQAARSTRQRALAAFGRRSSRDCRHTQLGPIRRGLPRWHWHRTGDDALDQQRRAACEAFAQAPPPPAKAGRRGAVWLGPTVVVKQREQGAARTLFTAMYWLLYAGVPQPQPVALRTFDGTGHLFAARLSAPDLATELRTGALPPAARLATARALGTAVGRLHAHGLRNRDLKLDNLVRDPRTGAVCMTDLDGVRRKRASDARGQGRDLGRLLAAFRGAGSPGGRAAVLTFARAYQRARQALLQPGHLLRLWRTAAQRADEWASAHRAD